MRLLYPFPEEWTGRRAREVQTLQTCLALADTGIEVSLVTAGGVEITAQAHRLGREKLPQTFTYCRLSRRIGPVKSTALYAWRLRRWLTHQPAPTHVYVIHLKAAQILRRLNIAYWWEAHEIFAETPSHGSAREQRLSQLEQEAVATATGRVATSEALAEALNQRYFRPGLPFHVIPNAGDPPLQASVADPVGPLVYAGSLGGWKGLPIALEAAVRVGIPVRVIGGTDQEWQQFVREKLPHKLGARIDWHPRTPLKNLSAMMRGCRAGIIPTSPETPSGRYSCPMKLFDYARCGLPVVTSALAALESLALGEWCRLVTRSSLEAWIMALQEPLTGGTDAINWAASHTWQARAHQLLKVFTST